MKGILVIISLFVWVTNSFGQAKFFKTYSDNGFDFGQGVVQLEDSSYMITGTSSSFISAPSEVFLMKLNKFGEHQWAKHYGGEESDQGKRILNWNDSVFFLAGNTQTLGENGFDVYLVKVDKLGNVLNEKIIGTNGWDRVNDALITPDSSVLMVGETTNTSNNNSNFYIIKTDHNGDTLWTKNFGSVGFDVLNTVVQYDATTFYAAGSHYNADSSLVKGVIVRFNELGDVDWIKEYGAHGEYMLHEIYFLPGKICGVGTRKHPVDGDQDEWQLRINDDGSPWLADLEQHFEGEVEFVGATLYGDDSKAYVAWYHNDQYSANNSFDISYSRYENYLDFEWFNPAVPTVSVNFLLDDVHGEMVRTSDGGWIAVGTLPSQEFGGSAVFVLKAGPNDDLPVVNLSTNGSLVELFEVNQDADIRVFPNPANENFTVKIAQTEAVQLMISDLNGRLLREETLFDQQVIETTTWKNGVYLLELKDKNGLLGRMKMMIQH
jgi:hypothetical protein